MCWTCLSGWITAQLWPQRSTADAELCGKSAVRLMQQVRVYQSVLRKPQLAKCFTLRQSTENKAGRETYLCFHSFNYNTLTPPGPRTVPVGWCAHGVMCWRTVRCGSLLGWRTQLTPDVGSRHLEAKPRAPMHRTRRVYQNSTQIRSSVEPKAKAASGCPGQLSRRLQARADSLVLSSRHLTLGCRFGLQMVSPPSQHLVWKLLLKGVTFVSFREEAQYSLKSELRGQKH